MSEINTAWNRITTWLKRNAPQDGDFKLPEPARKEDLAACEKAIGCRLPEDLRTSYRRHDGSRDMGLFEFIGGGYWMPLVRKKTDHFGHNIATLTWTWETYWDWHQQGKLGPRLGEPNGSFKPDYWNPRWIPFTNNGCGDCLAVDLDPPEEGSFGQVIYWCHEIGAMRLVAPSFGALMHHFADHLEAGSYSAYPFSASEEGFSLAEIRPTDEELYECSFPDLLIDFFQKPPAT